MKIMKYTLWATVGLSLLFASCESILDINPKDRLTTKDYFTNEEQLQLYSNQFYSNNFPGDGDIYRDDADMLIVSPLSDEVSGQRVIPETGGGWSWSALRSINFLLDNLGNCKDQKVRDKYEAGTRLVGEQPPLHAVHQHGAEAACHHLPKAEGLLKNPLEHRGQQRCVFRHQHHGQQKIAARHDRYQHIQHLDRGVFPQYDHRRQDHQQQRGVQRRHLKGIFKGAGDGIADDLADAAPANEAGDGKEHRHQRIAPLLPPQFPLDKGVDIVGGAASIAAVQRVLFLIKLRQGRLYKRSGGSQQRRDPHPEYCTRTTGGNGGHNAHQISHTHPGGRGNDQRLKSGDGISPFPGTLFHRQPQHLREQANRQHPGADRKIDARGDQQQYQQGNPRRAAARQGNSEKVSPQKIVHCGDDLNDQFHRMCLPLSEPCVFNCKDTGLLFLFPSI